MDKIAKDTKIRRPPIILLINPDMEEVKLLKSYFLKDGFRCSVAYDGISGIIHTLNDKADLIK